MPIFKLSAPKSYASVDWSLSRNASNSTCSDLDLKSFYRGRNPQNPQGRESEREERGREGKVKVKGDHTPVERRWVFISRTLAFEPVGG